MRVLKLAAAFAALGLSCTPEVDTDPLPEVMEFDPVGPPPRVAEPTFAVVNPTTRLIDLSVAGVEVPADCTTLPATVQAQCEFNQYLETLDGFPTTATARTPVSAAVDLSTVTAETVAVVEARTLQRLTDVNFTFELTNRYLQVSPKRSWPVGGFVWVGVRGYDKGIRTAVMPPDVVGKPVVASLAYNLLKREGMPGVPVLTCGADPTMPATIDPNCEYYRLLAQRSANDAATRGSLARLEVLRQATNMLGGWTLLEMLGGIPKAEAAILWGFPIHSAPVIDINPLAGVVPTVVGPNQIRLAVNGELNPATVGAFRIAEQEGSVYLLDLAALGQGRVGAGFPPIVASYAAGAITITTEAPLARGGLYGIAVTKSAQDLAGRAMVSPPISVLLMARGPVASADGKSLVSAASDLEAAQLEAGRQQLAALLNDPQLPGITGLSRATIAYLFAFAVPQ